MSNEADPWAGSASNDLLRVSNGSASQNHLRSRKTPSPAFGAASGSTLPAAAELVDRHPLRSPSPSQHVTSTRPSQPARRSSAVASEWKAIGAGLAGLFNGSSSSADSSGYKWPADPVSSANSQIHGDESYKGHSSDRIESTLDRLEDWFGLKNSRASPLPVAETPRPRPPQVSVPSANHATGKAEEIRVLIHPVAPADTLPSLALHYGADIQVLRKSNKLWPGDPVQIRKLIYVPVDSCKHRPPNAEIKVLPSQGGAISASHTEAVSGLAFVPKEEDEDVSVNAMSGGVADLTMSSSQSTLTPLVSIVDPASEFLPDTNKSYADNQLGEPSSSLGRATSINGSRQAYPASLAPSMRTAHNHAGRPPSRSASSVGAGSASASATSSSFVPPRGPIHVSKVPADKLRFFANDRKTVSNNSSTGGSKPGPGDTGYDPGESGIDDLLALRQQPRHPVMKEDTRLLSSGTDRPDFPRYDSVSNMSDMEEEEEWKPNTWHFGNTAADKGKLRSRNNGDTDVGASHGQSSFRTGHDNSAQSSTEYAGWNDAPLTHGTIAKAYDGGKAYNKRQAQKSHRLLYDLAAGLPPNPGAASKWARPIQFGDSLPGAPSGPSTRPSDKTRTSTNAIGQTHRSAGAPRGFGKLLDDTIRGRISVEAALEGAFEGVRASAQSSPVASRRQQGLSDDSTFISTQPPPRQSRGTTQQEAPQAVQPQQANGFRDPLTGSAPSPPAGLSKRRVDWTRSTKGD